MNGAKTKLLEIMTARSWHEIKGNKKAQTAAQQDKYLLRDGKLSYEKTVFWLKKLGYKMTSNEVWQKK